MSEETSISGATSVAARLNAEVLAPMKTAFVGKDEIIDLLGVALVAGENLFILGPPGTAKSAIVHDLGRRLHGQTFEYLLTRFTEPNEIFGPFDIRKLREGDLITNTEGMLPEASLVFLDELLNANSAILNSLLMVLNERVFRRGRENRPLPLLTAVGASNHLPEDEALGALFDRFLLRVRCDNVDDDRLTDVLEAGWKLESQRISANGHAEKSLSIDDLRQSLKKLSNVDLTGVRKPISTLVKKIRNAGFVISDRRAVKIQRLVAASAMLSGRASAQLSDLWVFRYIWDREEQVEVLVSLTDAALEPAKEETNMHPRAFSSRAPDAEELARDLKAISEQLTAADLRADVRAQLRDRAAILSQRIPWIVNENQREQLQQESDRVLAAAEPNE